MLHYQVQCLGQNRGTPRLWLQGRVLEVAGFAPGMTYSVEIGERRLHLRVAAEGNRVVSGKRRADRTLAVIDVNSGTQRATITDAAAIPISLIRRMITSPRTDQIACHPSRLRPLLFLRVTPGSTE